MPVGMTVNGLRQYTDSSGLAAFHEPGLNGRKVFFYLSSPGYEYPADGFGFHASTTCDAAGVPVLTNAVDWTTGELTFPNLDRCCPCSTCGTCKQAPLKDARRRGRTTVFVGDGISDRKAALLADVLFAKDNLADWCDDSGVDYRPFASLAGNHRLPLALSSPVGSTGCSVSARPGSSAWLWSSSSDMCCRLRAAG